MKIERILIGGQWRETKQTFTVRNPFLNNILAEVSMADRNEAEEAISLAETAANEMRMLPRFEIAGGLRNIAAEIKKRHKDFSEIIALESGKPIKTAIGEVERGIATFNWAAGEAERFAGEVVPVDTFATGRGKTAYTEKVPRGVIYGITPFNFPLNLVAHKVAPALAAGNSIIIKPSPKTPLTSLLLGEAFINSGLPKSALQIVPMDTKDIDLIYNDPRIAMISFTGSDAVGWELKNKAGKKAVALELGGNAPVIIDESANIARSLKQTTTGAFSYAGQVCISVQRIYVHAKLFDEWTSEFVENAKNLKVGNPLEEATELSVMIDEDSAIRAEKMIVEAAKNGAKILTGGKRDRAFLEATILTDTLPEMRIVSEEAFAPLVVVEKFNEFEEAIDLANQTKFGLQAGVFTENLGNVQTAVRNLDYGGVIINDVPTFRVDNMPYGGVKDSGFGREGVRYAMEEMSETKLVVLNS